MSEEQIVSQEPKEETKTPEPEKQYDFSKYGEDAKTIQELNANPDGIHDVLAAKRKANAEAKELREKLEALSEENSNKTEIEKKFEKTQKELEKTNEKLTKFETEIKEYQHREQLLKSGIRPDFINDAIRLIEDDDIDSYKEKYPQWFGVEKRLDNTGSITNPSKPIDIDSQIAEAKKAGDVKKVLELTFKKGKK